MFFYLAQQLQGWNLECETKPTFYDILTFHFLKSWHKNVWIVQLHILEEFQILDFRILDFWSEILNNFKFQFILI